jgi:hypothetical protein
MSDEIPARTETPREQAVGVVDAVLQVAAMIGSVVLVGAIICCGFAAPGCAPTATPQQAQQQQEEQADKRRLETQQKFVATLPKGVGDVRDEGGNNVSFIWNRDDRTHRYWAYYHIMGANTFRATITRMD